MTSSAAPATADSVARLSLGVLVAVVLVNAIAPLATDMYVPAFPAVGADLAASTTQVQLTLTTFFGGMALGQLVGGPHSDGRGRRVPLLLALVVLAVTSVACALSSSIGPLLVARLVQGPVTLSYIASSTFVLQVMNGLSPIQYSVVFAANAGGLTLTTLIAARLAGRTSTDRLIGIGLVATALAGLVLLVGAVWFAMPLGVAVVGFFVLMSAQGLVGPNSGALASDQVPRHPGTGSAVLGLAQWSMAGVIAPLTGLGGDTTAVPMAVIVLALVLASAVALLRLAHPAADRRAGPAVEPT